MQLRARACILIFNLRARSPLHYLPSRIARRRRPSTPFPRGLPCTTASEFWAFYPLPLLVRKIYTVCPQIRGIS